MDTRTPLIFTLYVYSLVFLQVIFDSVTHFTVSLLIEITDVFAQYTYNYFLASLLHFRSPRGRAFVQVRRPGFVSRAMAVRSVVDEEAMGRTVLLQLLRFFVVVISPMFHIHSSISPGVGQCGHHRTQFCRYPKNTKRERLLDLPYVQASLLGPFRRVSQTFRSEDVLSFQIFLILFIPCIVETNSQH
jgi:hypothetical protein